MGIIIYKTFKIIEENNIKNYEEFLNTIIKNKKIKNVVDIVINGFILISFYVMTAGFGAYLNQEYSINSLIGSGILALICYLVFIKNVKGLVKINEILMPILIFIILFIRNL